MDATIPQQIESLRKLKMKELKGRYLELFGEESRSSNHQHLFRRIAWRLQARAEGDLMGIPPKANGDSGRNANGIPGRRRTVLGA